MERDKLLLKNLTIICHNITKTLMFVYMDIKPIKLSYGNFSDTKYQLYVLI